MATTLNMLLQVRRDDFTAHGSYVLLAGEPGYCTVEKVFKIGDGTTTWENLGFANEAEIRAIVKAIDFPQSDWNQADSTQPDYIKNKPQEISDEEFLVWLNEAGVVEFLASTTGAIYTTNNNEIYIL